MPWAELLETARWAPSPHNIQTWKLRPLSDDEAELAYDPARTLPATDPGGAFIRVGLGVFVEMLAVAARGTGHELEVEWDQYEIDAARTEAGRVAGLRFVPTGEPPRFDPRLILERRTSRLPYDGRPVTEPVLRELERLSAETGHVFRFTNDPDVVNWVLELNRDTLFYDLADDAARNEIGSWLRFSEAAAAAKSDGFSPSCLGFPGWLLFVFFRLPALAQLPLVNGAIRRQYFATTKGTRTVAWLQGPFGGHRDSIEAGRLLARLWLALTEHGVQLHPFGSLITNARASARLRERIDVGQGEHRLWLIMRLGYSATPPRSHRLEVDELLLP